MNFYLQEAQVNQEGLKSSQNTSKSILSMGQRFQVWLAEDYILEG